MSWWYNVQIRTFKLFIISTYAFYISTAIGIGFINPEWYSHLDIFMKIYIGVFLMYRFNPFRTNIQFTDLDRMISFSAGVFIFSMFFINTFIKPLFEKYINSYHK